MYVSFPLDLGAESFWVAEVETLIRMNESSKIYSGQSP